MNPEQKRKSLKGLIQAVVKHVNNFTPKLKQGECTDIESGIFTSQFVQTPQSNFVVNTIKRKLADTGICVKTTFEPVIGESYQKLKIEVI